MIEDVNTQCCSQCPVYDLDWYGDRCWFQCDVKALHDADDLKWFSEIERYSR